MGSQEETTDNMFPEDTLLTGNREETAHLEPPNLAATSGGQEPFRVALQQLGVEASPRTASSTWLNRDGGLRKPA